MKKFINRPENVVEEMLQGLAVLSPGLARLSGHKVMIRADMDKIRDHQVAIISGGGSGHEPAHAGYIGEGMLSAGVAGEVIRDEAIPLDPWRQIEAKPNHPIAIAMEHQLLICA
jgi:dihydroxyacetone kinase